MSKNIRTQIGKVIGKTLNSYHARVKPVIDDIKFKEQYQGRIIDCMVGEIDDNYIETPETDSAIVKLEHSKEGIVKVPSIKGKTILIDSEGNETDTPAEGCRLVSVGEEEDNKLIILSKNKNLNPKTYMGAINNEGVFYKNTSSISSDYIRGYKGKSYTSSIRHNYYDVFYYVIYDLDKNYIETIPATSRTFVAPYDCYFRCWRTKNGTDEWMLVEEGDVQTTYVEPKHHKTEILLDEPLRSLPNGVCDEIVGNKLVRRVGKIVLDGSQNFSVDFNNINNGRVWIVIANVIKIKANAVDHNCYCDRFPTNNIPNVECCFVAYKNQVIFLPLVGRFSSAKEIREWFKNNPTTVIYELEEPVIIEMPNTLTLQGFDDTTMYIENSITPTVSYGYNALIPYKEELSKQKEEVETNTLDIENNIIPYLMDMEFNLMLMEDNE